VDSEIENASNPRLQRTRLRALGATARPRGRQPFGG
jgi:hypothetical protein